MAADTSQQQINGKTVKGPQDTEKQFVALGKAEINWPLNKLLHLLAWLLKIRFSKMCLIYTHTHTHTATEHTESSVSEPSLSF